MSENPLLNQNGLPAFSKIKPEHVEPAIDALLAEGRETVATLLASGGPYTWDNLIQPLELLDDRLGRAWSPVSHMNSVVNSDALREAYNACLPKLSDYSTEMGQNAELFKAYQAVADSANTDSLDTAQKKLLDNALRDFRLSGIDLDDTKQARFKEINQSLSTLTTRYEENLLDATHAWSKLIPSKKSLSGLPGYALDLAAQQANEESKKGWLLNLDMPCYIAVMSFADNRDLREEMYRAYITRASDQGPQAGQWDNSEVMEDILALRHERAQLLGFDSHAHRSLATKMASSPDQVLDFLNDLAERSLSVARQDIDELKAFAKDEFNVTQMEAWDIGYYSEKLRQKKYNISQEDLKPYFAENRVIQGMFDVVHRLYDINVEAIDAPDVWHKDVLFFSIKDANGNTRGQFYLDLYARQNKRGGAWMDDCVTRIKRDDDIQIPVAYLTCNLTPPVGDKPALFTHDEVITLFHEFGHGLHHMLTQVDYASVSGINGVEWDAVELPSQFMENWCWEREALDVISGHYETGAPIPQDLFDRMQAARTFQSAMQMLRQIEFSIFDFRIHLDYDPDKGGRVYEILNDVRSKVAVVFPPEFSRFAHGFSHIFAGGYAAGYYSYKWAEVLSADAFARFEQEGIFNQTAGQSFLNNVLEAGGSRDAMDSFVAFRGREPQIDALLRHNGIAV